MDNQRVFIWAALALVLYLNFMAWQKDYAPPPGAGQHCGYANADCKRHIARANDTLPDVAVERCDRAACVRRAAHRPPH